MLAQGKSATCLSYRLWIRRDLAPHNGHSATPPSDRTAKIIESDESLTLSQPTRHKRRDSNTGSHGADSPVGEPKLGSKIIRCESDPLLHAYSHVDGVKV